MTDGQALLASLLRHDAKQNTYKIALVRALGDVRLAHPGIAGDVGVAVPLRALAEWWLAYYWPFVDDRAPILQGPRGRRSGVEVHDVSFRPALTHLRTLWRELVGIDGAADGYTVMNEMRVRRRRETYPPEFMRAYTEALAALTDALRQPLRFAGPGMHGVFQKPARADTLGVPALPGTRPNDACVIVPPAVWDALATLSLWVEALCVYEWSRFAAKRLGQERARVYALLTARPENRRPLTWERNEVEVLMLEGRRFRCPWTGRVLTPDAYDLDHVVPISVYPINELWNLVPADRSFNQHRKRDRLPGPAVLADAVGTLEETYGQYGTSRGLSGVLRDDVMGRFGLGEAELGAVARAVASFVEAVANGRNLPRF